MTNTSRVSKYAPDRVVRIARKTDSAQDEFLRILSYAMQLLLYFVSRVVPNQEVSILMYHSVGVNDSFYTVSPYEFARQVDYLRKNHRIVSLDEIADFAEGKRNLPGKCVAITFDDGYYDNYVHAFPYLREHGLPAAIFVCTSRVGLDILLDTIPLKALGWKEIVEMSRSNIIIGAHTVSHPDLCELSIDQTKHEIEGAKTAIERGIGMKVDFFSYPSDRYNERIVGLVRSLGFRGAVGGAGLVHQGSQVYLLPRVQVDASIPFFMFKARLSRAFDWYKRILEFTKSIGVPKCLGLS